MSIELDLKKIFQTALQKLNVEVSLDDVVIETVKNKEYGDYASNVGMKYSKLLGGNPRVASSQIVPYIQADFIEKVEIAGPGFINIFIKKDAINSTISNIIELGDNYGKGETKNKRINVEFVSANPTGDLHLGHARCAAVGDSICRLYEFAGYDVTREFYVNNAGNQIALLGKSLDIRYRQLFGENVELPEDSYHAIDIVNIATKIKSEYGDKFLNKDETLYKELTQIGMNEELEKIKRDLDLFRVNFDVYSLETDIRKDGHVEHVLNDLYKDYTYIQDGATFLRTTDFLDDKDRPVVKSDGSFTYVMPDIAYHLNKLSRNFDLLIDILGADHHGYINRMKSALMMQGYSKDVLEVELVQIVRLIKDGLEVKMSKRTGAGITLRELCEEVGVDAVRYFFVSRAASAHLDFNMNLATEQSSANPVYYAQYAHARLSKVLATANDIPLDLAGKNLGDSHEIELLKTLLEFPKLIEVSASRREPHMVATYIQKLAALIHSFYTECRVINRDNLEVTSSRLALAKAAKIVMKNALNVIGVSAPDNM